MFFIHLSTTYHHPYNLFLKIRNKKEKGEATRQNIQKQIAKVQILYQRLNNIRTDYINKVVSNVVRNKPSYITIEDLNVKGMMSVSSQVLEDFRRIGYTVECRILNAKDFGVPQNRERLIFIGNRLNIDNGKIFDDIMKESAAIPNFVLDDALYGLRPLKAMRQRNATEMDTVESGKKIDVNNCENNEYLNFLL